MLVLVVLGAAVAGGRTAGVTSALSATLSYDFFLTIPYGSFTMERGDDIETTVLLALVAGELVDRARRNEAAAIARRRELDQIRRRAELAAGGERPGRLIEMSAAELTEILDLKACRYVPTPAPETLPVFTHTAIVVPSVMNDDAPHGAVALPVRAHDRDLGHFLLVFPTPSFGIGIPTDASTPPSPSPINSAWNCSATSGPDRDRPESNSGAGLESKNTRRRRARRH